MFCLQKTKNSGQIRKLYRWKNESGQCRTDSNVSLQAGEMVSDFTNTIENVEIAALGIGVTVDRCIDWEKSFDLQDPAHQLDTSCSTFI